MGMPTELRVLMERFNQLGRLLPKRNELDLENQDARAEAEIILTEMEHVKAQIDAFLGIPHEWAL